MSTIKVTYILDGWKRWCIIFQKPNDNQQLFQFATEANQKKWEKSDENIDATKQCTFDIIITWTLQRTIRIVLDTYVVPQRQMVYKPCQWFVYVQKDG